MKKFVTVIALNFEKISA